MEEQQSRAAKDGHSNLYDSQEFKAMIGHLNKAIHSNHNVLSNHLINSPFYRQRLNEIYKDSIGSTKRIMWYQTGDYFILYF